MDKKILIYGFGPYAQYSHNVTMDVIENLTCFKHIQTHIFQTRFSATMFEQVLKRYHPSLIIGLGQDSRAKKIRIERKAVNWKKDLSSPGEVIRRGGPEHRYVPLKLKSNAHSTITYDAGNYVCNYSMYLMSEYAEKFSCEYAFLHLPIEVDTHNVIKFIKSIIE